MSGPALRATCAISNLIHMTDLREAPLSPPFCRRKLGLSMVNIQPGVFCLAGNEAGLDLGCLT